MLLPKYLCSLNGWVSMTPCCTMILLSCMADFLNNFLLLSSALLSCHNHHEKLTCFLGWLFLNINFCNLRFIKFIIQHFIISPAESPIFKYKVFWQSILMNLLFWRKNLDRQLLPRETNQCNALLYNSSLHLGHV